MRISDWSSDVCSSDLLGVGEQRGEQFDGGVQALAQRAATEDVERLVGEIDRGLDVHAQRQQFGGDGIDAARELAVQRAAGGAGEIGRASRVERVGKYV